MDTVRVSTQEMTSRFIDGQIELNSFRGVRRGEIAAIIEKDGVTYFHLTWLALKIGGVWVDCVAEAQKIRLALCQCKEDVGQYAKVLIVDYPYLCLTLTLFPHKHRTNIKRKDVLPRPMWY